MLTQHNPYVLVVDVGATSTRIGLLHPNQNLAAPSARFDTPSKRRTPNANLIELQESLVSMISAQVKSLCDRYPELMLRYLAISFGAVLTKDGVIADASILWGEKHIKFDFLSHLKQLLPALKITIVNDVSAAAWRHRHEGRFALYTVSSGVACKVFDDSLPFSKKLILDEAGLGGEAGHVTVNPFEKIVLGAQLRNSKQRSVHELAATLGVPVCDCSNIADLNSYTSGPATLKIIKHAALRDKSQFLNSEIGKLSNGDVDNLSCEYAAQAIHLGDKWLTDILSKSTIYLALRILQLVAELGLEKVIITGGFANSMGAPYFEILRKNLHELCNFSGYFSSWTNHKLDQLILDSKDHDNDSMIGAGIMLQAQLAQNRQLFKFVNESHCNIITSDIPACGKQHAIAKIEFAGICSTDLQIVSGYRSDEPGVLGHECVGRIVSIGSEIHGLSIGDWIVINPNNPLDQSDKIGHSRDGVFQDYFRFDRSMIEKGQIIKVPSGKKEYVLLELFACVIHSQRRLTEDYTGKNVLIYGSGISGLMHCMLAKAKNAAKVCLINRSWEKIAFAIEKGIVEKEHIFLEENDSFGDWVLENTKGEGFDFVISALALDAGSTRVDSMVKSAKDGGTLVLFGGFSNTNTIPVDLTDGKTLDVFQLRNAGAATEFEINRKKINFIGSRGSIYEDYLNALNLVETGKVDLSRLITHIISFESLPEIFRLLKDDKYLDGRLSFRVVVNYGSSDDINEPRAEENLH